MPVNLELYVVASLLRRGRILDQLSTGLTLLGVFFGLLHVLLLTPLLPAVAISAWLIIFGLCQKYWALRVAFDADLFALAAENADESLGCTKALDQALQHLRLQPANSVARPWAERQRGALKLLRTQAVLTGMQALPILTVILASPWLFVAG